MVWRTHHTCYITKALGKINQIKEKKQENRSIQRTRRTNKEKQKTIKIRIRIKRINQIKEVTVKTIH